MNTITQFFTNNKPTVHCTGYWRTEKGQESLDELNWQLNGWLGYLHLYNRWTIETISQRDEGIGQAKNAWAHMDDAGYIDKYLTEESDVILFVGAGRGSSQYTFLDKYGNVIDFIGLSGYPKNGEPDMKLFVDNAATIRMRYSSFIKTIVLFDSLYHILKKTCPVIPELEELPDSIETYGRDFLELGYLTDLYKNTPTVVIRNFKIDNVLCKITYLPFNETPQYDLGSGKLAYTNTLTGQVIKNWDLPENYQDNPNSIIEIANAIEDIYDMDFE